MRPPKGYRRISTRDVQVNDILWMDNRANKVTAVAQTPTDTLVHYSWQQSGEDADRIGGLVWVKRSWPTRVP